MFEYIKGRVDDVYLDKIILDVGGIGYRIQSTTTSASNVVKEDTVTIYTYLVLREDEVNLYGFTTREELEMFQLLTSVTKVGPKVAISALSTYTPKKLANYILNKDITGISKAPGIGKKTAERIILELKDKVDKYLGDTDDIDDINIKMDRTHQQEVVEALTALGYSIQEAEGALLSLNSKDLSTEEMIKEALKLLMR
ncbi:MAG: Holliday junction branch migration protein RuvA [Clostridiales bacterium]|nr:Holliday junction branch migration protein RuvA [Clostridiales bacterium]